MKPYESMIAITNRHLVNVPDGSTPKDAYLAQLRRIVSFRPKMIVMREKDMAEPDYIALAAEVQKICREAGIPFVIHNFIHAAGELGIAHIHLPFPYIKEDLRDNLRREIGEEVIFGTSVHSVEDALWAKECGASWLFAGNVYETDCKKGLPGRGLDFIRRVTEAVDIPVYGIGGISPENLPEVVEAGAAGGCMMSGFMRL